MKVLLINSTSHYVKHKPALPLGLLSIATYLKSNGHTVKICDRAIDGGSIRKQIDSFAPNIVGVSAIAVKNYFDAIKISKVVKKKNIPVVWGGQLPSLTPELVLKSGAVDYVVIGEGEITMLALINTIIGKTSLHDVDGLAFVENGTPIVNKDRDFTDLKELPIIDFSFVDPRKYFAIHMNCKKMLHIYSTKGCLYNCAYCYNPHYCKHVWRARPAEYFLSEIKYLVDNFGMDGVFFADDLFSANKEYLINVCDNIAKSGIDFVWGCDMRADTCTKEELQMMYDAGCRWIFFGIETGSEERQKKINKGLNLNKAKLTLKSCAEIGIVSISSFIIGFPDETEDELKETVRYIQSINSSAKLAYFFGPVPKSEIYNSLINSKKLIVPQTFKELERLKQWDQHGMVFSNVTKLEYKVISSYFFWMNFSKKYSESESRVYAKKAIGETLNILKRGPRNLFLFFVAAREFLSIVFYSSMFPQIRKKYKLNRDNYK